MISRVIFLSLVIATSQVFAAWRDVYEATVRVEVPGAAGSGIVFWVDDRFVWVLTNAHVVGRSSSARVIPFQDGKQLRPATGTVTLRRMDGYTDAAVVRIPRQVWPGRLSFVPLSLAVPAQGQQIVTVGCPAADWPSLWHGTVRQVRWPHFSFFPGRAGSRDMMSGRSGSAICDVWGTKVIGLLTWYDPSTRNGKAQILRFVIQRLWESRMEVPSSAPRIPKHYEPLHWQEKAGDLAPVSLPSTQPGDSVQAQECPD